MNHNRLISPSDEPWIQTDLRSWTWEKPYSMDYMSPRGGEIVGMALGCEREGKDIWIRWEPEWPWANTGVPKWLLDHALVEAVHTTIENVVSVLSGFNLYVPLPPDFPPKFFHENSKILRAVSPILRPKKFFRPVPEIFPE